MKLHKILEEIDPKLKKNDPHYKKLVETIKFLEGKKKVLFISTSNRGEWAMKELKEEPKSTKLAKAIQSYLGKSNGNSCGVKKSALKDKDKNPTGHHRCWRNINNPDDELWKISKELFESDAVIFFGSIRWGQMNAQYQNLIERLTWLENRHTTLGESNLLKDVSCGIIATGQNWNGAEVIGTQKQVLSFFGFDVKDELCWNWQYTTNSNDETQKSYKNSSKEFNETFELD